MLKIKRASIDFALLFAFVQALMAATLAIDRKYPHGVVMWPLDGVLLACMLQPFRSRPWSALAVGEIAFAVAALTAGEKGAPLVATSAISAASVAVMYTLVVRYVGRSIATDSRVLFRFLLALVPICASTALIATPLLQLKLSGGPLAVFLAIFASTSVGYGVSTPVALLLTAHPLRVPHDWRMASRKSGILGLYTVLVFLSFWQVGTPLMFLIPFGLIGVAFTCDFASVATAVLITAIVSILLTLMGHGPVSAFSHSLAQRNLMLQVFLGVVTGAALPVGALMAEHARLKDRLIAARVEAEAASEAKTTFLATISHEIRTPLNGVLGMAQAMAQDDLSSAQRERIEILQSSGEALVSLLNEVLDLSKIEAGMLTLESIDFDLGRLLSTTLQSYEAIAGHKELTLEMDVGEAGGVYRGDPTRVRQIVSNLVSNALKFTTLGGVRVIAATHGDGLSITVSDTGVGIPADKLDDLFQKFRQADASTTRRFGGTGLGLSICRELADLMGGSIDVRSRDGEGSEFVVRLPLLREAGEVGAALSPEPVRTSRVASRLCGTPLRVLAAEDNVTNQLVLRTLLRIIDVDATIVGDGVEAVARWREQAWDLILVDVQMPLLVGPTAPAIIREEEALDPSRPRTPILAVTANTLTHQVTAYLDAGMDGHLAKPISAPALFDALAKHASRYDMPAAGGENERAVA